MTPPVIISLGEVLWDLFPDDPRFGGAPANFAAHAAMLGGDVTMVSAVGDDTRGVEAIRILEDFGIRTDLIQTLPEAPTGSVGVELDERGKPTYTIHVGSAWDQLSWTPELGERIKGSTAVYFGTLGQRSAASRGTIERALDSAAEVAVPRVLDVNLRPPFFDDVLIRNSLKHASILKLSDDELTPVCAAAEIAPTANPQKALRALLERFRLDLVAMTRGANGAMLISPEESIDQPGIPTSVRDTVGAGDAFTASMVTGLLRGDSLADIARDSCQLASRVCSKPGAVPEFPSQAKPIA